MRGFRIRVHTPTGRVIFHIPGLALDIEGPGEGFIAELFEAFHASAGGEARFDALLVGELDVVGGDVGLGLILIGAVPRPPPLQLLQPLLVLLNLPLIRFRSVVVVFHIDLFEPTVLTHDPLPQLVLDDVLRRNHMVVQAQNLRRLILHILVATFFFEGSAEAVLLLEVLELVLDVFELEAAAVLALPKELALRIRTLRHHCVMEADGGGLDGHVVGLLVPREAHVGVMLLLRDQHLPRLRLLVVHIPNGLVALNHLIDFLGLGELLGVVPVEVLLHLGGPLVDPLLLPFVRLRIVERKLGVRAVRNG
eukprot:CAMPEP_0170551990 /NCGR_PEP_ID=MMETSP0211-20121228/9973_1 /TAXON_ID=311385 /ORGANISM="Pseudokeronopsis sp., Strain OXSARD2" /LENGTH=307 /DNA_ID=CAMNT_0010859495 /DNA_START=413 /DNA_END=1336 /DNA_ORIENTATION=+